MQSLCETTDLLVFSHIRWDFVFQRPQHLTSRHAKHRRVFYFEEPVFGMTEIPRLHLKETSENVLVAVPYLPKDLDSSKRDQVLTDLVDELIYEEELIDYSILYYSPKALSFTKHLEPRAIIFDCIEIAPSEHTHLEDELVKMADVVFTNGHSIFEAKKEEHHNIHSFPSSIDISHFHQARQKLHEPDDQKCIPHPRIGFYGVIDERFNTELLSEMAEMRTDYHFIVIGPVVKVDPSTLPRKENIHYLGMKDYQTLPYYVSGWDCSMMPFMVNEMTRFISPIKTPELLAAGRPVVSTSIQDVVYPYGVNGLIHVGDTSEEFISGIEKALHERKRPEWMDKVDHFLRDHSWDNTFNKMSSLEKKITRPRSGSDIPKIIHPISLNISGAI